MSKIGYFSHLCILLLFCITEWIQFDNSTNFLISVAKYFFQHFHVTYIIKLLSKIHKLFSGMRNCQLATLYLILVKIHRMTFTSYALHWRRTQWGGKHQKIRCFSKLGTHLRKKVLKMARKLVPHNMVLLPPIIWWLRRPLDALHLPASNIEYSVYCLISFGCNDILPLFSYKHRAAIDG